MEVIPFSPLDSKFTSYRVKSPRSLSFSPDPFHSYPKSKELKHSLSTALSESPNHVAQSQKHGKHFSYFNNSEAEERIRRCKEGWKRDRPNWWTGRHRASLEVWQSAWHLEMALSLKKQSSHSINENIPAYTK